MDIRHIPGKKNPVDSLSSQLVSDTLVRKGSVKDANAGYVQKLRISDSATDQEIQDALHQLFKSSPQGHQILSFKSPQGSIKLMNEDTSPKGTETRPTVVATTAISKVQLDNQLTNSLYSLLQYEIPYYEIFKELSGGARQIIYIYIPLPRSPPLGGASEKRVRPAHSGPPVGWFLARLDFDKKGLRWRRRWTGDGRLCAAECAQR